MYLKLILSRIFQARYCHFRENNIGTIASMPRSKESRQKRILRATLSSAPMDRNPTMNDITIMIAIKSRPILGRPSRSIRAET